MIPLYAILAEQNPFTSLPLVMLIVSVAILVMAFLFGYIKGFRRIGWGGLAWLLTCVVFVIADGILRQTLISPFTNMGFSTDMAAFLAALVVAVVCIVIVLALHGIMTLCLRPKVKWMDALEDDDNDLAEFGLEYEDEYDAYDVYEGFERRGKTMYRSGYENPSLVNRIFGGLASAAKALMILFIALSFAVFFVGATKVSTGPLGIILKAENVQTVWNFATRYALEFLSIGLVIVFGVKGYTKGLLSSLRSLIVIGGAIAAAVFSFLLPFTQLSLAEEGIFYFLGRLVTRCVNLFGGAENMMAFVVGRILAGVCLLVFFTVILILINIILKKCCRMVQGTKPVRVLDGSLACLIFLAIGVVLVIAIWCILYTVDYCGIFHTTEIFTKDAALANGLYKFGESMMKPYIDKFIQR